MVGSVYLSSTRLVVRPRALPQFLRATERVQAQLRRTDGYLGGALLVEPRLAFWTLTAWDGPRAMRAFRDGGAHALVMPLLADIGTEAAYVGWHQDDATLPPWAEVHRQFLAGATSTPLRRPTRRHQQRQIPAPRRGLSRPLPPLPPLPATVLPPPPRQRTGDERPVRSADRPS